MRPQRSPPLLRALFCIYKITNLCYYIIRYRRLSVSVPTRKGGLYDDYPAFVAVVSGHSVLRRVVAGRICRPRSDEQRAFVGGSDNHFREPGRRFLPHLGPFVVRVRGDGSACSRLLLWLHWVNPASQQTPGGSISQRVNEPGSTSQGRTKSTVFRRRMAVDAAARRVYCHHVTPTR